MPAYGPLNSGFSGVHLLWNHPDAPYPCGTSMNHPDHIAGRLLAVGVLAALAERERRASVTPRDGPDRGVGLPDRREVPRGCASWCGSRAARQPPPARFAARRVPVGRRGPMGCDRGDGRRRVARAVHRSRMARRFVARPRGRSRRGRARTSTPGSRSGRSHVRRRTRPSTSRRTASPPCRSWARTTTTPIRTCSSGERS